ncbi:cellulose binding domain-containing protein [Micromonospora purpureochromogenes]|uniref:cellulose binding domain-containing protein n=1 Tax=Micromonospora purpureochromogenes TaxID=47872 RepID=UPI0033E59D52
MPSSPPQPRRTVAVILLDRTVALAGHARRAVGGLAASSGRTRVLLAALLVVLVATTASVVLVLRTPERLAPVALDPPPDVALPTDPAVGGPDPHARPAASSPAATRRTTTAAGPPVGAAAPPATAPSARTPSAAGSSTPAALRAAFAIEERALLSYGADVTISNAGRTRVTNWTLVITLPRESLEISSVSGARATRAGATWTFVPDETTAEVAAGSSVQVTFRVSGAPISSTPTACTIDGAACTGLPD